MRLRLQAAGLEEPREATGRGYLERYGNTARADLAREPRIFGAELRHLREHSVQLFRLLLRARLHRQPRLLGGGEYARICLCVHFLHRCGDGRLLLARRLLLRLAQQPLHLLLLLRRRR